MQFTGRKKIEQFVILGVIIVAVVAVSGCSSERTWSSLSSGAYRAFPFTYSKGDRLDVILNSASEPLNIIILHGGNFTRYQQGDDYFADEYWKGVNSTRFDFLVPQDGEYYLILENRGPNEVKIDLSYVSHAITRYETKPIEGTIRPTQKEPQGVSGNLVQTLLTPLTTAIPVQTTQTVAVPPQTDQIPETITSEAQQLYEEGLLLTEKGDLSGALKLFDQALQLDPDNDIIWNARAGVLFYEGRYAEALIAAEKAITLDPNDAAAWNIKAGALNELGRYAEALTAAEKAIILDPDNDFPWKSKAIALINLERYEETLTAAERATTLDPNDAAAWNIKAGALDELGRYTEALTAAEIATTADPEYALAWNTQGWIQINLGRYADAIKSFDRALEIDPDFEQAKNNKALALERLGS